MIELARLGAFVVFLILGASVARAKRRRRAAVNALILYVIAVHAALVVAGSDAWPFTTYPLIQKKSRGDALYRQIVFLGVDAQGRQWEVDPGAWQPASRPVLMQWFVATFPRLPQNAQQRAAHFLFTKAEERRAAMVRGEREPHARLLGPFTAPDWWVYVRPTTTSPTSFVGLRVYEDRLIPRERAAGRPPRQRTLIVEGR